MGGIISLPPSREDGELTRTLMPSPIECKEESDQICWLITVITAVLTCEIAAPFSSDRQRLSYDGCLDVKGEIIRTVLCCIVY